MRVALLGCGTVGSEVVRLLHTSGDDLTARGRRVIVALPPTLTGRIAWDPQMPPLRDQLTQRMPQGTVIKCMAVYDEPFWRADGLSGQATSDAGPVRVTFDNSPPSGKPGVLLGFLEGDFARRAVGARREVILSAGAFGTPQILQLSGIGDPEHLGGVGIATQVASLGVGRNLSDHYVMRLVAELRDLCESTFASMVSVLASACPARGQPC